MGRKQPPPQREKSPIEHLREAEMNRGRAALYAASGPRGTAISRSNARKWLGLIATVVVGGAIIWALAF
jgi:hypothetical protein